MSFAIDTSVLVSSMVAGENHYESCVQLLDSGRTSMYSHGITETLSTLKGGRRGFRMRARQVAALLGLTGVPHGAFGAHGQPSRALGLSA